MPETVFILLKDKKELEWETDSNLLSAKVADWSGEGFHLFKHGYTNEVAPYCNTDRLTDYVNHHKPKGVGAKFYLEPPVEQAREAINTAQEKANWAEYIMDKTGTKYFLPK